MTETVQPPPAEAPLEPDDIEPIHAAILSGYSRPDDIERRISHKWGIRLRDKVYLERPNDRVVQDLIEWAEEQGRGRELVGLLWSGKPGNPKLRAMAEHLLGNIEEVATRYSSEWRPEDVPVLAVTREVLEKTVTERSRLENFGTFLDRLGQVGKSVCRIDAAGSTGTGFLVGRSSVLTNFHVVENAANMGAPGDRIVCRFDYRDDDGDGVADDGTVHEGAADLAWLAARSPYSQSDLSGAGSPAPNELDFALIRLVAPVDAGRPHLVLDRDPPAVVPLDVAFIVQHPDGDPLKIALGTIVEFPATGLRYRYNVTTKSGASGSPVFSSEVKLIGLHHAADPAGAPRYNQAVPIWRVVRAIASAGISPEAL